MPEQHNEVSGTVHGSVIQARDIQVVACPSEPTYPPLTSWYDRPELTPELIDLLTALRQATEALPYSLLGVKQPELSMVYVRQTMRLLPTEAKRKLSEERSLGVIEALNRDRHLVITGEPGAGKSTLGHMYVQRISDYWLSRDTSQPPVTEPVLPLRVPARALASEEAWGDLLATGAQQTVGRLANQRPRPNLFAGRALGARWLIFIDGLDEIAQPEVRREVIRAIAHQVRFNTDYRLIITTRPLPERELEPLADMVDRYAILPFGPMELDEFAKAWFRAQDPLTASDRARDFVLEVGHGSLRDPVRNPLLATIAAVAKTIEPRRRLPNNRADLYDRFMSYLLADKPSGRRTIAELRHALADQAARLRLAEWMNERRIEIVTRLAIHRLEAESPLFEAACEWVAANHTELPDDWKEDLRALLVGTGVFVRTEDALRFLHHSFAEFLAARRRAEDIPADFPDLNIWIELSLQPARQAFALFTFVLWGRRPSHDIGLVLRKLLDEGADQVLLAGLLLAEEVTVADGLANAVVDRIVDLVLTNGTVEDPWDKSEEIGTVLASFGAKAVIDSVFDRLRGLRDRPEIAVVTRIECAAVLGHLIDPAEAAQWLTSFAVKLDPPAVCHIATSLVNLVSDGADRAERLLVQMVTNAQHELIVGMAAIVRLRELGRTDAAVNLVRDLVRTAEGRTPTRVRDSWQEPAPGWDDFADLAADLGCAEEALWATRKVFAEPLVSTTRFCSAAGAVLRTLGAEVLDEVVAAAVRQPVKTVAQVAFDLWQAEYPAAAATLAWNVLRSRNLTEDTFGRAAAVLLRVDGAELWSFVENAPWLPAQHRLTMGEYADLDDARRIAGPMLTEESIDTWEFDRAANIVLSVADPEQADAVYRAALGRPPHYWARVAPLLCRAGFPDLGGELIGKLLEFPVEEDTLLDVARNLQRYDSQDLAGSVIAAVMRVSDDLSRYAQCRLARLLAVTGRTDEAVAAARKAFIGAAAEDEDLRTETRVWLDVGGAKCANDIVAWLLDHDIRADFRMGIAEILVDHGLLAPAVRLWLDVVRCHGEAVGQGVEAASRLIKCGHRDDAVAVIKDVVADQRISDPTKARMRALLVWVNAIG